jgi:hypothetical protein
MAVTCDVMIAKLLDAASRVTIGTFGRWNLRF